MDIKGLLIFLIVSAVTGWLVGSFLKNGGLGFLGNILVGIIGGVAGGILFKLLAVSSGGLNAIMAAAVVGAAALLFVIARFKNRKESSIHYKGDELWVRRKPLNRR